VWITDDLENARQPSAQFFGVGTLVIEELAIRTLEVLERLATVVVEDLLLEELTWALDKVEVG